ncbi:MAG: hypothetical protein AB1489_18420 [Acidobacteriota bacterium]
MTKLEIKTESLPKRCEICHQADQFDPQKNVCIRCAKLNTEQLRNKPYTCITIDSLLKNLEQHRITFVTIPALILALALCWIINLRFGVFELTISIVVCLVVVPTVIKSVLQQLTNLKKCPFCSALINKQLKKCNYCNSSIENISIEK